MDARNRIRLGLMSVACLVAVCSTAAGQVQDPKAGAALARMEGEVVFNALLSRCRRIDARFDEPDWRPTLTLRGLAALPVEVAA